jgi:hypothetical protein
MSSQATLAWVNAAMVKISRAFFPGASTGLVVGTATLITIAYTTIGKGPPVVFAANAVRDIDTYTSVRPTRLPGDGDLSGSPVILASRMAAKAQGGEILASMAVRELCAGKGFAFADLGDHELRGFEDPVRVFEVQWRD